MPIQFITPSIISSVANTQVTGTITASQIATVNANTITSGSIPLAQVPRLTGVKMPTGSVLQVVQATTTSMTSTTTGNTNTDTALTGSITPTSSSSRILVFVSLPFLVASTSASTFVGFGLKRNSTIIYTPANDGSGGFNYGIGAATQIDGVFNLQFLDSPASSSAVSYTVFFNLYAGSGALVRAPYNVGGTTAQTAVITLMEIAV